MGKATRWLKGLLTGGVKRTAAATKDRSLVSSFRSEDADIVGSQGRAASTVAAASSAVAQAAVATAQAAVAVMKLTSSGRICGAPTAKIAVELAAVKIQSVFRGYLARRALKALKGLVKLQALVRGHIVRKRTAENFRRMQALLRVQARARTCRQPFVSPCPPHKDYYRRTISHAAGEGVMMIDSDMLQSPGWKWLDKCMEQCYWDTQQGRSSADMEADVKTLEIDDGRPPPPTTSSNASRLSCGQYYPSSPSSKLPSQRRIATSPLSMDSHNGSQFFSTSSARTSRGAFSPTTSECSGSFLSGYIGHPSYMAYTESSRAKKRSSSAPKQRADFESAVAAKKGARVRNNGHYGRHYMCSPSPSSRAYSYGTPARFEYHRGDGGDGMGMAVGL